MNKQESERLRAIYEQDAERQKKMLNWIVTCRVIAVVLVPFIPGIVTNYSWGYDFDFNDYNEIGDAIGGVLGPTVGLIGAALTFLAFWVQFKANQEQKKALLEQQIQIEGQSHRESRDLFENKFFTMLSIHRDNVKEMDINNDSGRKVFVRLTDELRFLYARIKQLSQSSDLSGETRASLSNDVLFQIAYLSFFFGIGEKSTPLVKDLVGDELHGFVEFTHEKMGKNGTSAANVDIREVEIDGKIFSWKYREMPGEGHLRRLSHYVRHLYQMVKFVDDQPEDFLSDADKYEYVTTLRAQLSAHEQLLLYYNALSILGQPWLSRVNDKSENYFEKYCMIKSVPLNSADFYKKPQSVFPGKNKLGKPMFEWVEIKERMKEIR